MLLLAINQYKTGFFFTFERVIIKSTQNEKDHAYKKIFLLNDTADFVKYCQYKCPKQGKNTAPAKYPIDKYGND